MRSSNGMSLFLVYEIALYEFFECAEFHLDWCCFLLDI